MNNNSACISLLTMQTSNKERNVF